MMEAAQPTINDLMLMLEHMVSHFKLTTAFYDQSLVLEYIWDNLEHRLVEEGLISRDFDYGEED